jgi:formylglycine-generating enzyme required for sulfatase activity
MTICHRSNSGNVVLDGVTGDIIVMDQQGNIFIHPKEMGYIHHSSFFSQKPIAFGAMVRIKDGELMRSDSTKDKLEKVTLFPDRIRGFDCPDGLFYYSGHYDPWDGSSQERERIKQNALNNFKKELTAIHSPLAEMVKLLNSGFVSIPGGTYEIGSPETDPNHRENEKLHKIELSPFSIMEAAVTQESYARLMGYNPCYKVQNDCHQSFKEIIVKGVKIPVCADHPVETVSWVDAKKFAELLSKQDGKYTYNLPTEAQLEVAFRGGTKTAYVSGRDDETGLGDYVWYSANSGSQTHPVKSKLANKFGIYRSGVWEWAQDLYNDDYAGSTGLDPQGPTSSFIGRVFRGGGYNTDAQSCRSAVRGGLNEGHGLYGLGFRLVRCRVDSQGNCIKS